MSPRSSFFLDRFGGMREKRVLGGGEGKTKLRGRGDVESIVKIDLRCLYL